MDIIQKFNKLISDSCDFISDQKLYNEIVEDLKSINSYKKIEQELGIDLITYFKIKVGTKVYTNLLIDDDLIIDYISGSGKDTMYHIVKRYSRSGVYVKLDEYGRNWALTKEEL